MFEKILIAIDFSARTPKILQCVREIPGVKEIVLFHVFDATFESIHGWTYDPAIENARILMDESKQILESSGYLVTGNVEVLTGGEVYREILLAAESNGVSLIVTGARGKSLISDIFLGSVSQNILRHAKTNVLVFHDSMIEEILSSPNGKCPELFLRVLIPTDFSEHSRHIAVWARGLTGIGTIILLHVIIRGNTEREIGDFERDAQKNLDDFSRIFTGSGIPVISRIRIGDPAEMILSVAESDDASVILMSPHGTGGFLELFLGSTSFEVEKRENRPMLVVKTGN
jgi:nucleotide-binding universal stress UspA family protein